MKSNFLSIIFKKIIYLFLFFLTTSSFVWAKESEKSRLFFGASNSAFIENKGQFVNDKGEVANNIIAKLSGIGVDVFVTTSGVTYLFLKQEELEKDGNDDNDSEKEEEAFEYSRLDAILVGAQIKRENVTFEKPSDQGVISYFYPHCPNGIANVNEYCKLSVKNIYPEIDWILYTSSDGGMKYDFIIHPGADIRKVRLCYKGALSIDLSDSNSLTFESAFGKIKEGELLCYEKKSLKKITSEYVIKNNEVSFQISDYDHACDLVIDPPLTWFTYYGGTSADGSRDIHIDSNGNTYIVGYTFSAAFPTDSMSGAFFQGAHAGGGHDGVIIKFNSAGVRQWAAYYGGSGSDVARNVISDAAGDIFVLGSTTSSNLPTQNLLGAYWQPLNGGMRDAFILKFNSTGVRQWSTYYGGNGDESDFNSSFAPWGLHMDSFGNVYMIGSTTSSNFPLKNLVGAYNQSVFGGVMDAFILRFNTSGVCQWATYYGGNDADFGYDITTDASGEVFITGSTFSTVFPTLNPLGGAFFQPVNGGNDDMFIAKFGANNALQWGTFCGGNFSDAGNGVDVDIFGNVYVVGNSNSSNGFPLQNLVGAYNQGPNAGINNMVIMKFNAAGICSWSTFYGGTGGSYAHRVTTDAIGNVFVVGKAYANFLPLNPGGVFYQATNAGSFDACIVQFTPTNTAYWSTYFGGTGNDEWATATTIDVNNCLYVTGEVLSALGNPTMVNPGGGAYFVAKNTSDEIFITRFCCNAVVVSAGDNVSITAGQSTTLSASGVGSYSWSPSIGLSCASCQFPSAGPTETTTYYLTVTDAGGCTSLDSVLVSVEKVCGDLYVPNSFSPNDDGSNDVYFIYGNCINKMTFIIYNRWGEVVFETDDPAVGWDGAYKGKKMDVSVFAYLLKANLISNEEVVKQGNISLVR